MGRGHASAAVAQAEAAQALGQAARERSPAALADDRLVGSMHTQSVTAKVLLPREAFPAGLAGVGPLAGVRANVPLQDPFLFGRVGAERTFVKLDRHH